MLFLDLGLLVLALTIVFLVSALRRGEARSAYERLDQRHNEAARLSMRMNKLPSLRVAAESSGASTSAGRASRQRIHLNADAAGLEGVTPSDFGVGFKVLRGSLIVEWDSSGRHRVSWPFALRCSDLNEEDSEKRVRSGGGGGGGGHGNGDGGRSHGQGEEEASLLSPGGCYLDQFPLVETYEPHGQPDAVQLTGKRLEALRRLILSVCARVAKENAGGAPASCTDEPKDASSSRATERITDVGADAVDRFGHHVVHALVLANTNDAVDVALEVLRRRPELLTQACAPGYYHGQNVLHLFAVLHRQEDALQLLRLAEERLNDGQIRCLLQSYAQGEFFRRPPMCFYGGSPVAYLAAFGATQVLSHLISRTRFREQLDDLLHRPELACPLSGLLPLHAAAANASPAAYDLLVQHGVDSLTPTCPPTQPPPFGHTLDSRAVDPDDPGGSGVIAAWVASERIAAARTWNQAGSEDDPSATMAGLSALQMACKCGHRAMVEHILRRRWVLEWRWGRVASYRLNLTDIDSAQRAISLMDSVVQPGMPAATSALILDDFMDGFVYQLFEDKWANFGRTLFLFWVGVDVIELCLLATLGLSLKEQPLTASRGALPYATATLASVQMGYEIFKAWLWVEDRGSMPPVKILRTALNHLLAVVASLSVTFKAHTPSADGDGDEAAWALLSISIFSTFSSFVAIAFIPHQRFGIFAQVIERLLILDVPVFLCFFFIYLFCFWVSMYLNYPRAGTGTLSIVPQFNNMLDSLEAMINLVMTGTTFDIDFHSAEVQHIDDSDALHLYGSHSKLANLALFTAFYYYCMLLLVILLLRLLMAMLSATFQEVRQAATLQWRLQFARFVLELESVWQRLGGCSNAGVYLGPEAGWTWAFRVVEENGEGGGGAGQRQDPRQRHKETGPPDGDHADAPTQPPAAKPRERGPGESTQRSSSGGQRLVSPLPAASARHAASSREAHGTSYRTSNTRPLHAMEA